MGVDRKPQDRFSSDKDVANQSIRYFLAFIGDNEENLKKVRGGEKMFRDAKAIGEEFKQTGEMSPGQRSYIENIYEKVFQAAGFESAKRHVDRKRRGLKFG